MRVVRQLGEDIRAGVRGLTRSPRTALMAMASLTVATGLVTVVYSVFDAVVLRAVPGPDGGRLVSIAHVRPSATVRFGFASLEVEQLRSRSNLFDSAVTYQLPKPVKWQNGPQVTEVVAGVVSHDFFSVFGIRPILGNTFDWKVVGVDQEDTAVVSHRFWTERLGRDPAIVGKPLNIEGQSYRVLGVMPASFRLPSAGVEVWVADNWRPRGGLSAGSRPYWIIALPSRGLSSDDIKTMLKNDPGPAAYGADGSVLQYSVLLLRDSLTGASGPALRMFLAAAGLVTVVACVNVTILLLIRNAARRREFAIHVALGVNVSRLIRQTVIEAFLLSLSGGVCGAVLAGTGVQLVRAAGSAAIPRLAEATIDARVLPAVLLTAILASLISILPAFQARYFSIASALRGASSVEAPSGRARRMAPEGSLILVEVALTLVLVAGAGLLLRSLTILLTVDLGFNPHGLIGVEFTRTGKGDVNHEFADRAMQALNGIPEVKDTAIVREIRFRSGTSLAAERAPGVWIPFPLVLEDAVSDNAFAVLEIPLLSGRTFTSEDRSDGPCVAVVNSVLASTAWPQQDPVGQTMDLVTDLRGMPTGRPVFCKVIGVVGSTRLRPEHELEPQIYHSYRRYVTNRALVVRTRDADLAALPMVAERAGSFDAGYRVKWIGSVEGLVRESAVSPRFYAVFFGLFGILALALSAIGVYGIVTQAVARRWREIGVRLAIGAQPTSIRTLVLRYAARWLALGAAAGVPIALGMNQMMTALLFQVVPGDAIALVVAAAVVVGTGLAAAFMPAIRASQADPTILLRTD